MKLYILLAGILTLTIFQSCKTTKAFTEMTPDDIQIKMDAGACFGSCPMYTLSVYEGGYVTYEGKKFTEKKGKWLKKLDKDTYKSLIETFEISKFNTFQDYYESEIPDLQTIKITYKNKFVAGKDGRPVVIMKLQETLENIIASTEGWTQIETPDDNKNVSSNRPQKKVSENNFKELILEPIEGAPMARILSKYRKDYGLRLIKKIKIDGNLWLVSYNTNKVEPKVLIEVLKKDESIKHVEFNKIVKMRGASK